MSRVIRPESAARMRTKLLQELALAIAADQNDDLGESERREILAHVAHILDEILTPVAATSSAWEKRGYWVKADRFMMEWSWVQKARDRFMLALEKPESRTCLAVDPELGQRLSDVKIPPRMRQTKPWSGASQRRDHPATSLDAE